MAQNMELKALIEESLEEISNPKHFGNSKQLELTKLSTIIANAIPGLPATSGDTEKDSSHQFWMKGRKLLREFGSGGERSDANKPNGIYPRIDGVSYELGSLIVRELKDENGNDVPKENQEYAAINKDDFDEEMHEKFDIVGATQIGRNWVVSKEWWCEEVPNLGMTGGAWLYKNAAPTGQGRGRRKNSDSPKIKAKTTTKQPTLEEILASASLADIEAALAKKITHEVSAS